MKFFKPKITFAGFTLPYLKSTLDNAFRKSLLKFKQHLQRQATPILESE